MVPEKKTYTDKEIQMYWDAFVAGHELAFDIVYEAMTPRMRAFAYNITESTDLAKDVSQDVFTEIYQRPPKIEKGIINYLIKATRNRCLNKIKKSKRLVSEDELKNRVSSCSLNGYEFEEWLQIIKQRIAKDDEYLSLIMKMTGYTTEEIAFKIKVGIPMVRKKVYQARQKVKDLPLVKELLS